MRTVKFKELEPGMIITGGLLHQPAVILEIKRFTSTRSGPVIGLLKIIDCLGKRHPSASKTDRFTVLHEQDTVSYAVVIERIEQTRLAWIKDAEEDCEILRGFLG